MTTRRACRRRCRRGRIAFRRRDFHADRGRVATTDAMRRRSSVTDALAELTERCRTVAAGGGRLRRRAALDRSRRAHVRRRHHRVAGVLDAAVGTGVRALAGRTRDLPTCPTSRIRCRPTATATACASGSTGRSGTTRSPPTPAPHCSRRSRSPASTRRSPRWCCPATARRSAAAATSPSSARFADPASAHLARTRHSPALVLDELTARLGRGCRAEVHGQVLGSGLEMAAYCGWVRAHPDAVLGLPELSLGLIPGAGGTVSITRRIGRWRTAYLVLSGRRIDAATALRWGLVDEVGDCRRDFGSASGRLSACSTPKSQKWHAGQHGVAQHATHRLVPGGLERRSRGRRRQAVALFRRRPRGVPRSRRCGPRARRALPAPGRRSVPRRLRGRGRHSMPVPRLGVERATAATFASRTSPGPSTTDECGAGRPPNSTSASTSGTTCGSATRCGPRPTMWGGARRSGRQPLVPAGRARTKSSSSPG